MTDKLIFDKVLKKAKQNGFDFKDGGMCWLQDEEPVLEGWEYLKYKYLIIVGVDSTSHTFMGLNDLIFSHEFAIAFWGEEYDSNLEDCPNSCECSYLVWEYHLRQMILEKEPLKYLEKFL